MTASVLQLIVVAGCVAASALYATWAILGHAARLRLLDLLEHGLGTNKITARLKSKTLAALSGGCGSCAANSADSAKQARVPHSTPKTRP